MKRIGLGGLALVGTLSLLAAPASAQVCVGVCGTLGANGVVTAAPSGASTYGFVTTTGGVTGGGQLPGVDNSGAVNGSSFTSALFAGNIGDILSFNFNYVTSDGSGFADYAWARLLAGDGVTQVALLFTARTDPTVNIVPGAGLPAPAATLNPATVLINAGTTWSALGDWSGSCYAEGCGYSGWVGSTYQLAVAGNFYLQFGVTNWLDDLYDSGLAFDGLKIGDVVIGAPPDTSVPEPGTISLVALGLVGIAGARFWRRRKV